jgi:hypothetical protein
VSTIVTVDVSLVEVCELEQEADGEDDGPVVAACQIVLDRLLDKRIHLPQQRPS